MEAMSMGTFIWTTLGAFLTLCIFSFLYQDNPFYKLAEHLVVGVSAGYFVIILWHNGLQPNLFDRLNDGNWYLLWLDSSKPWYMIPAILGVMMWTRFSRKWSWISRWPIALYMGIATGVAVPLEMKNRVNVQLYSTMKDIEWGSFLGNGLLDGGSGLAELIIFLGTVSALFYFFFSKEHTGVFKGVARFGIWILMIGFGASFGYTVMGRISLFVQRIQYLGDWTKVAWDDVSSGAFIVFWFIVITIFGILAFYEIIRFVNKRGTQA
ncbi:MAG: hypothetical protein JSV44_00465 [Candidatus Zixiibacteriota bacterium]|nr:MAG: hypothetical protein JSV44_00465 [candidate division Zixibacteria bacterium]